MISLMTYSIVWIYVCQKKGGLEKHSYLKYALAWYGFEHDLS